MATSALDGIKACVFDAYGTLFDFTAAAERCRDVLGDKVDDLNRIWRAKQLQYTWLRSLMGRHTDFWHITGDSLDYALATLGIDDAALRSRLMQLYLNLDAFPEVPNMLKTLKSRGIKTAILSNGAPAMLEAAAKSANIRPLLDAVLSVEEVGVFKPHPSVYQLAVDKLGVAPNQISFQSANAWDANGAAALGLRVVWINRTGEMAEKLPEAPDAEIASLADLPDLIGPDLVATGG